MDLSDLSKNLQQMSDEELLAVITKARGNRRATAATPKPKRVANPKSELAGLEKLSAEQIDQLLELLS